MPTPDFLLPLLRRWYLLVGAALIGALLGAALLPVPSTRTGKFKATALLLPSQSVIAANGTAKTSPQLLIQAKALVTQGSLPSAVAVDTAYPGGVVGLIGNLEATVPDGGSLLNLSFTDDDQGRAAQVLDAVANRLVDTLTAQNQQNRETRRRTLEQTIATYNARIASLTDRAKTDASAKADLDQTNKLAQGATTELANLGTQTDEPPLRSSGPAISAPVSAGSSPLAVLRPLPVRLLLGALVALGALIVALVGFDRLDVRLRTKAAAELAFDLPVLAEVPRTRRAGTEIFAGDRSSAFSESHRIMRTAVQVTPPTVPGQPSATTVPAVAPQVILITSADPGEGKTTTAVNLAASFVEAGKRTILAGFDLRHADLHKSTGRLESSHYTIGGDLGTPYLQIDDAITPIAGLRLITVAGDVPHPAMAMPTLRAHLDHLRTEADVIIVDSPPLLVCNDTAELLGGVDTVLVVCRVGRTTLAAAERLAEVLGRLRAPVSGLVLAGARLRATVRRGYGPEYATPLPPALPPPAVEAPAEPGEPADVPPTVPAASNGLTTVGGATSAAGSDQP